MTDLELIDQIKAHPVCDKFVSLTGAFVVYYPAPYRIPGGASVTRTGNNVVDLGWLLKQIDNFWNAQRLKIASDT